MKNQFKTSAPRLRGLLVLHVALVTLVAGFAAILFWQSLPASYAQDEGGTAYLPAQMAPVPTATPGPPPQFVKNVPLPKAQCPNNAGFNQVSDLMYIANIYSDNVSIFQDREFVSDIFAGEWPREIASDPNSSRTWVAAMHSGTALVEGTALSGMVPRDYEPYSLTFNPVNGYVYVSDLNGDIQVIDGPKLVKTIEVTDPVTGENGGDWLRSILVDPRTGLVYTPSWISGRLYVIEGTEVINSVQLGSGPLNMAFDANRGLITVAHWGPDERYPHDVSVVDVESLDVTFIATSPGQINRAQDVAVDGRSGLTYVTNPDRDNVTVLDGTTIVGTIGVGDQPWGIGVNPNDGYVFVTNRESDDVSILLNGVLLETVKMQGEDPYAVGIDTNDNDIYILNRGKKVATATCKRASVTILH